MSTLQLILTLIVTQAVAGQLLGTIVRQGPTTDAQGRPVTQCYSDSEGTRMNGEEWVTANGFWKVRCNNGTISIIGLVSIFAIFIKYLPTACIATRRANFTEVPLDQTVTVDGWWYKCSQKPDTKSVQYTEGLYLQLVIYCCCKLNYRTRLSSNG